MLRQILHAKTRLMPWLFVLVCLVACRPCMAQAPDAPDAPDAPPTTQGQPVEVRFTDGSVMRLGLLPDFIEIETNAGSVCVLTEQIGEIVFAQRLDRQMQERVDSALTALADPDQAVASAADEALFTLGTVAYLSVLQAVSSEDTALARRAFDLSQRIEERYRSELVSLRGSDLIMADGEKIVGTVSQASLPVYTQPFGNQVMQLAHVQSLVAEGYVPREEVALEVLPDPGGITAYREEVGQVFRFRVTGGNGSVWGTDIYTDDSLLAAAAVHAGVLEMEEEGVVLVRIVRPGEVFTGTARNGITSRDWQKYPGAYEILGGE